MKKIKNIDKLILLFILIGLFFVVYTFYKDNILWDGEKRNYYSFFYIISASFSLMMFFMLFMEKKIKENLIAILISLLFSVYLCEIYLLISNNKLFAQVKNEYKFTLFDEYEKELKIDSDSVITFPPQDNIGKKTNFFPLSGISQRNTLFCNENGYWAKYLSDNYGFNNPKNNLKKSNFDIVLIGDSFGHGACVNFENTIHGYLEDNFRTLNLSYAGNSALIEYATLREYLPHTTTKNVLWLFFEGNDTSDLIYEYSNPILTSYIRDKNYSQNLINHQDKIDKLYLDKSAIIKKNLNSSINTKENRNKNITNIKSFTAATIKLSNMRREIRNLKYFLNKNKKNKFKEIFYEINHYLKKTKINLCFVYIPDWNRFIVKDYDNFDLKLTQKVAKENKIPFVDTLKIFNKIKNIEDYYALKYDHSGGHFNERGYKVVVDEIVKTKGCII